MKRFLIDTSVENAEGTQTWFVDAETEEEALDKFSAVGGDPYESNVDVTQCGEPEISGEVPLDDFGRFAEQPPAAQEGVGLTDEQIDKAATKLAECMDYPWAQMPEQGKMEMRNHAKAVIEASGITKGQP
jgi:hypothetical protein